MENTIVNILDEKLENNILSDQQIKQHTKWIAKSAFIPVINTNIGLYINPFCYNLEGYSLSYFN